MNVTPRSNQEWSKLAATDPLHAIASDKGRRRHEGAAWTNQQFFEKGVALYGLVRPWVLRVEDRNVALDIGCGAGRLSRQLAGDFGKVIGVDVAERMVVLARDLNQDVPNAEFRVGAGDVLPADSESVNLVFSLQVLQHIDSGALPGLIRDIARVLVPGGRVLVHIPRANLRHRLSTMVRLAGVRRMVTRLALQFKPDLDVSRRPWVVSQYHTYPTDTVTAWFRDAGFKDIEPLEFRPGQPLTAVYSARRD